MNARQTGKHKAINLFAYNFVKQFTDLNFFFTTKLTDIYIIDSWIAHHTLNVQLHYLVIYH